jgi:nicotinamide-nucleotide amidase
MKAEIIAVGTELLMGQVVNSNAAYLSEQLQDL